MDALPRSCCDPGDTIDLKQIDYDYLVHFASFCISFTRRVVSFFAETALGGEGTAHSSSGSDQKQKLLMRDMEEYVDHLRLPASTRIGIDFKDPHLWRTIFFIVMNPLIWNIVARIEYKTKILTRICLDHRKLACFFLAVLIITLGFWRNHLFNLTCHTQPSWIILRQNRVLILGYLSCVIGTTFVVTSFYQLGFFATFLGDYFGIFTHSEMVTSFPFSVVDDPMYFGSFLNFFGVALVKSSPAGILLALLVGVVYKVALFFETPFVQQVYEAKRMETAKMRLDDDELEGVEEEEEKEEDEFGPQRVRKKEE